MEHSLDCEPCTEFGGRKFQRKVSEILNTTDNPQIKKIITHTTLYSVIRETQNFSQLEKRKRHETDNKYTHPQ
jgi:hypothetical protein